MNGRIRRMWDWLNYVRPWPQNVCPHCLGEGGFDVNYGLPSGTYFDECSHCGGTGVTSNGETL